jgi:hypothetical protein
VSAVAFTMPGWTPADAPPNKTVTFAAGSNASAAPVRAVGPGPGAEVQPSAVHSQVSPSIVVDAAVTAASRVAGEEA